MKSFSRILATALFGAAALLSTGGARAQGYPNRPVRLVVGFAPGGFTDVLARLTAEKLRERLGQSFIVENKAGATGTIAADSVAKAPPDGYTLLMAHVNSNSVAPALFPALPYDVIKDFTPIVRVASTPLLLVVHPSVAANDVRSFVELAKGKKLSFASSGTGSAQHLAAEQFMLATGTQMVHVPYRGSGQGIVDLLSGRVDLNFESPPNTLQHIQAGKLRALAITSDKRSELLPDVPTVAEAGVPNYQIEQWFAVMGPPNLPGDITARLNKEINQILNAPDTVEKIRQQGGQVIGGTPDEFAAFLKDDTVRWAKLVKDAGIKPEGQ